MNAVEQAYARGETDEFVKPTVVVNGGGEPVARVKDGDALVFFNFRADRAREITRAFMQADFKDFDASARPRLSAFAGMAQYDETFDLPAAFPPEQPTEIFPEIVSRAGLKQLPLRRDREVRPRHLLLQRRAGDGLPRRGPGARSQPARREDLRREAGDERPRGHRQGGRGGQSGRYGFILVNYANPDMVGHTGRLDAAVKAVKVVDGCIGRLWAAAKEAGMALIVTADHGNCEMMVDPVTGEPHTAHTLGPVPFILADPDLRGAKLRQDGVLADVAPTALRSSGSPSRRR